MKVLDHRFQVKPLSANRMFARKGRTTFKTADYNHFQEELYDELKGVEWCFGKEEVNVIVHAGLSNRGADIDNVIKPLLDTLQSIYEDFNDNKVYGIVLCKDIVPKGEEYLHVTITERKSDED